MIVDELVTLLEFDVKGKDKAESFNLVLKKIEDSAKALVLSLTAAAASVGYFADRVSKEISENYEWAKSVGVAADSYQRFEYAATIVGGSLDSIKGDLEGWVRSAKASGMTLEEVFMREAKAVEGMSTEQARAMLNARGYSDTAIRMITQGEGKLKEYFAQVDVIPEKHLEAAREYAITWRKVTFEINKAMSAAVAAALPYIQNVLKTVGDFISTNKELFKSSVSAFFKSLAITLVMVLKPLSAIISAFMWLLRILDKATFGVGKYIIIIGALTLAFEMLAIAMVMKTAKGTALLMGNFSNMIGVLTKAIDYTTELILEITTMGVKQTFLNSQLVIATKAWWANTKAVWANLMASLKNLGYMIKEFMFYKVFNSELGIRIGLWWLETKAKVQNGFATASLSIKEGIHNTVMIVKNGLLKAQIFLYHKLWLGMLTYIAAVGKAIISGISWAGSVVGAIIPAMIGFGASIFSTVIPAIWGAVAATWAWTVALLANPITWIFIGVAAIIAAIVGLVYVMIKYWDEIVAVLKVIWDAIVRFFQILWEGIKKVFKFYINCYKMVWNGIKALGLAYINVIKKVFNFYVSIYKSIWNGIKAVCGFLVNGVKKALDTVKGLAIKVFNAIKSFIFKGINAIISVINKIPGINIKKFGEADLSTPENAYNSLQSIPTGKGMIPADNTGSIKTNGKVLNNTSYYQDNKKITINTNATSGPAIASYIKANDMTRGGYANAGAY